LGVIWRRFFSGAGAFDHRRHAEQLTATFLFGLTLFLTAGLRARYLRRQGWGEARLIWEDVPEALADLGLKD